MFRGLPTKGATSFVRLPEGIWFAEAYSYSLKHYTDGGQGEVIPCWLDVRNPYYPTDREADRFYSDVGPKFVAFTKLLRKKGFDCYVQGNESGSVTVFETVKIMNAATGKLM